MDHIEQLKLLKKYIKNTAKPLQKEYTADELALLNGPYGGVIDVSTVNDLLEVLITGGFEEFYSTYMKSMPEYFN